MRVCWFRCDGCGLRFMVNSQGQKSAQGILLLWNPNLGPNSGKRVLDARILDPNFWVEFFDSAFSAKEAPSKIHPREIHLPKFTFQNSTQKSGQKIHIAPLQVHFLVAQCSATPSTVAATPPCSATPFQTTKFRCDTSRHKGGGGGATPKFLGGVARHRCYTCKTL